MTLDDLQCVEKALNVQLPQHYVEFMQQYPEALHRTAISVGGTMQTPAEWEFAGSIDKIIEINRATTMPDVEWTEEGPWPKDMFVIGEDIGGDMFAISLNGISLEVFCFEHEDGTFEVRAPSLHVYVQQVLQEYEAWANRRLQLKL